MRALNSFTTINDHLYRVSDGRGIGFGIGFGIVIVIYKIEYYYSLLYPVITYCNLL